MGYNAIGNLGIFTHVSSNPGIAVPNYYPVDGVGDEVGTRLPDEFSLV